MLNKKLITIVILMLLISLTATALQLGPNYEKDCSNGICSITEYSYQKYYQENSQWKQIDENFGTQNCQQGYVYCVDSNLYQFHIQSNSLLPKFTLPDSSYSIGLSSMAGKSTFNNNLQIQGSVATYKDILPGISVSYQYLPDKIKQNIIIDSYTSLLSQISEGTQTIPIQFQLDNNYQYSTSNNGISMNKGTNTISQILPVIICVGHTHMIPVRL